MDMSRVETSLQQTQNMCISLGCLYITWEKFTEGEMWIHKCLAQCYNSCAHINLASVCLNMERMEDLELILRAFLGRPEAIEQHRAKAMILMSRCCVWNQEFDRAKEWMQKAIWYGEKWNFGSSKISDITYE